MIKQTTKNSAAGWVAMAALGVLTGCSQAPKPTDPQAAATSTRPSPSGAALSAGGQALLAATVSSGTSDLRWPGFSDYGKHVKTFYDLNGGSLWWVKDLEPTPQARQIIALLLQADLKGLSAEDYDGPLWSGRLAELKPATRNPEEANAVRFDLALTVGVMRYISDLHIGKVNPKHFDFAFNQESKKYDLAEFLRDRVVGAADVAGALAQVEPPYPGYRGVIRALQKYKDLAKNDDGELLPAIQKTIAPGDTYSGVPRLARLLRSVGDLPADAAVSPDGSTYEAVLVDAIRKFQLRHGRDPDGRIGTQTLADLNVPLSRRVQQMELALERWRWMPESFQRAPIIVNIPEFRLRAYDKDFNVALTMNVIVGNSFGHDTPVFADEMEQVIFRPYWAVPLSIVRSELIPHILKDSDYLTKKGFEIVDSRQNLVGKAGTRDSVNQLRSGKLFIRQIPGPKNSLGLLLFLFPNSYNIYMHDTPAPEFFAKSRRDFSHGCIRLEKPRQLAAWVLRDNPGWSPQLIREAIDGNTTQRINLAHPIPVLLVYLTAVVLEDGLVHFFDDIYGHDKALEAALAKGYPYPE